MIISFWRLRGLALRENVQKCICFNILRGFFSRKKMSGQSQVGVQTVQTPILNALFCQNHGVDRFFGHPLMYLVHINPEKWFWCSLGAFLSFQRFLTMSGHRMSGHRDAPVLKASQPLRYITRSIWIVPNRFQQEMKKLSCESSSGWCFHRESSGQSLSGHVQTAENAVKWDHTVLETLTIWLYSHPSRFPAI